MKNNNLCISIMCIDIPWDLSPSFPNIWHSFNWFPSSFWIQSREKPELKRLQMDENFCLGVIERFRRREFCFVCRCFRVSSHQHINYSSKNSKVWVWSWANESHLYCGKKHHGNSCLPTISVLRVFQRFQLKFHLFERITRGMLFQFFHKLSQWGNCKKKEKKYMSKMWKCNC